jgi:hypothetical protein
LGGGERKWKNWNQELQIIKKKSKYVGEEAERVVTLSLTEEGLRAIVGQTEFE